MRRAELRNELERLGSRPVPLPDPRRVDLIEDRLLQDFVVAPTSSAAAALASARRRRRVVMAGGLGAAATFAAAVLHRGSAPGFELQAASGAVALFPDGDSRPVHAGDQIPPGGLIQTGPSGAVTIEGTKIGSDQVVLLSEEGLTLLPSHSQSDQAGTEAAPAPTSAVPPASTATTQVAAPPEASVATAPATVAAPAPSSPVVPPADPVAPTTTPETTATAAPTPALFTQPIDHLALTIGEDTGGVSLAWTPCDAPDFGRYVIARGTAADHQLVDFAELGDRQITSFTDPAAPHGVALLYRVVAMSEDGRPLAASDVVELTLDDGSASSAPTTGGPPATDGSGSGLTVPPTTGPGSTSVPPTTAPVTTSPTTGEPVTTGEATSTTSAGSAPTTTTVTTSGRPSGPSTTAVPTTIVSPPSAPPAAGSAPAGPPTATTQPGG
jgi:hypothetical protein